jgi:hypothetical protein
MSFTQMAPGSALVTPDARVTLPARRSPLPDEAYVRRCSRLRRFIFCCLSIVTAVVALGVAQPAGADPVAVLAAVKGRVEVTSAKGGQPVRASFGRPLERGDKVTVSAGGTASIFFDDGNVVELAEKSALVIGGRVGQTAKAGPGAGVPTEVYAEVSRYATGGSRQSGLVAVSSLRAGDVARALVIEPRQTSVLDPRPSFVWDSVGSAARYRITVSNDEGQLWSRESTAPRLDYPADAAPLAAGTDLMWSVQAFSEQGPLRTEETTFHVANADEAAAVRANVARIDSGAGGPGQPAAHFLAGTYLLGRGFYADASRRLEALVQLTPDAPAPHEALGNVWRAVGLMDRAAAEYERALVLSREP